mmetsp:Transcript_30744/g.46613  ORF Transcript_30744/g.46613 Transcript_30744/m.46613 type:complete len:176 (+) Transcript_30744:1153-1680(+)
MNEDKAFALCTRLAAAYFHELHCRARTGVSNSLNTVDRKALASIIWYSGCQTHDVMLEFQALDWKDHSVISGVYIRYMVENSQSTAPTTFESQIKELTASLSSTEKVAKSAKKAASSASSKADLAKKEAKKIENYTRHSTFQKLEATVKNLQTDIKNLEDKFKTGPAKAEKGDKP